MENLDSLNSKNALLQQGLYVVPLKKFSCHSRLYRLNLGHLPVKVSMSNDRRSVGQRMKRKKADLSRRDNSTCIRE